MSSSPVASAKVTVSLGGEQRADAAAAAVLRRLLEVVGENMAGALDGKDPEHLHQLRIAVRKSRSVQRQFQGVFPALELPGLRADFRWLQRATGEARDLDVHLEDFDELAEMIPRRMRADLEPVRLGLGHRRELARRGLLLALRSARTEALIEDWERLLETLVELPIDDRPDARRSIGSLTGERIASVYGKILKQGGRLTEESRGERFHDLRKKGKELRYLLELFGTQIFPEEAVGPLVGSLKSLQTLLGRHQDREVQAELLGSLVDEVGPLPGGSRACLAMGVLMGRLRDDEIQARREFAESFADLASRHRRGDLGEALGG